MNSSKYIFLILIFFSFSATAGHLVAGYGTTPESAQEAAYKNAISEVKNRAGGARCIGRADGSQALKYEGKEGRLEKFTVHVSHERGSCKLASKEQEAIKKLTGIDISKW